MFEIEIGWQDTFLSLPKSKNENKMKRWREKRERKRKVLVACFHLQFWFKVKGLHLVMAFFPAEFRTGLDLTWQMTAWEF